MYSYMVMKVKDRQPRPPQERPMTVNDALRSIAGFFVLASVALGYFVHPGFFLFTAFVLSLIHI